jgi:glycosyltransferase involved in cell wall biosynthesis
MRIGLLASHPVQYQAPWFRELAKDTDLHVFFAHRQTAAEQAGFGVAFDWDLDLLSGYRHTFLRNVARHPSVNRFFGCDTPEIAEIIRVGGQPPARQSGYGGGARSEIGGQIRFDAFIVTGWYLKSYWQAARACRHANVPVLVRGDSQLDQMRSPLKNAIKQLTYRFVLRQFDGFLSVGQRNREYLLHYGVPAGKIFFSPHFVDNERFAKQAEALRHSKSPAYAQGFGAAGPACAQGSGMAGRSEIRSQWKIPEDAFCVLFCGKFIPKKRPLDLIEAARLLLQEGQLPNIHLLFAGSGELGSQLRANCNVAFDAETNQRSAVTGQKSLGEPITDNQKPSASFAGFLNQTELARAYVAADVLVLPSDGRETWGLVVNEAMACGLPAIVSNAVGCAPDLIEQGKTGFTFPVGNCRELGQRLKELAAAKEAGHDFRPAVFSKLRDYSIAAATRGTLEAVTKVIERRSKK